MRAAIADTSAQCIRRAGAIDAASVRCDSQSVRHAMHQTKKFWPCDI